MIITRLLFYSGQMSNNNLFLASDLNMGLVANAFSKHTKKTHWVIDISSIWRKGVYYLLNMHTKNISGYSGQIHYTCKSGIVLTVDSE